MTLLNRHDEGLATPSPALNTEKGDALFEVLLKGRRFQSMAVRPLGGRIARPEPLGIEGRPSSIAANPASNGARRGAGYVQGRS